MRFKECVAGLGKYCVDEIGGGHTEIAQSYILKSLHMHGEIHV